MKNSISSEAGPILPTLNVHSGSTLAQMSINRTSESQREENSSFYPVIVNNDEVGKLSLSQLLRPTLQAHDSHPSQSGSFLR
jgi:hypothetical protein